MTNPNRSALLKAEAALLKAEAATEAALRKAEAAAVERLSAYEAAVVKRLSADATDALADEAYHAAYSNDWVAYSVATKALLDS